MPTRGRGGGPFQTNAIKGKGASRNAVMDSKGSRRPRARGQPRNEIGSCATVARRLREQSTKQPVTSATKLLRCGLAVRCFRSRGAAAERTGESPLCATEAARIMLQILFFGHGSEHRDLANKQCGRREWQCIRDRPPSMSYRVARRATRPTAST